MHKAFTFDIDGAGVGATTKGRCTNRFHKLTLPKQDLWLLPEFIHFKPLVLYKYFSIFKYS